LRISTSTTGCTVRYLPNPKVYGNAVTPTTTTIEISTPCELSFSHRGPVRFLVSNLTMASSSTIPLLRFRFLWFDVTREGYLSNSIGMIFYD